VSRDSKHVLPVAGYQVLIDPISREEIEVAVIGMGVHAPELQALDVGETRAELVAQHA
jgi:hypothetical protein